ncbi:MAG TPA: sensor domain-containing protein [Gammaproteobacteria bacterium]|nr:sensor domain-containing protein [Gammaproteobacteria bacterium]
MNNTVPRSVKEYLDQLRDALSGADPALIQDALYDAEEYLRGELAEHPDKTEEQVLAAIATSYGAPEEVAEAYRTTEAKVQAALRTPRPERRRSAIGRFFGVLADPRAYTSLFYIVLMMFTGVFYFTWVVAGTALSFGLMPLIIGVPFFLLFLGSVRMLSLVEGRIVETFLGIRMPRRPPHPGARVPLLTHVKELLVDGRTWSTMLYMLMQLFLGIIYSTFTIAWLVISLALILAPLEMLIGGHVLVWGLYVTLPFTPIMVGLGLLLLISLMHLVKGIGYLQGNLAKHLLVHVDGQVG